MVSCKACSGQNGNDVAKAVKIPVIGLGGISTAEDAIEFLMAGATAIR